MNCAETRLAIESIENLRREEHILPDEVREHIKECASCEKYYKGSQKLEAVLFKEMKNVDPPAIPSISEILPKPRGLFKRAPFLIPATAAAVVLVTLLVFALPDAKKVSDISTSLLDYLLKNTILFDEVHAESVETVFADFKDSTGITPSIPDEIDTSTIQKAKFLSMCQSYACLFLANDKENNYILTVFSADCASWTCCGNERCFCLNDEDVVIERWREGKLGYMWIRPKEGKRNKYIR